MMHSRKSMATAAPTIISGSHVLGSTSGNPGARDAMMHASGSNGDGLPGGAGAGGGESFFDMEKARLVDEISGAFEELMSSTNVLNRKLEEVFGVGKEFETVSNLWGKFNSLIREQNIDPQHPSNINPHSDDSTDFLRASHQQIGPGQQHQGHDGPRGDRDGHGRIHGQGGRGSEDLRRSTGVPGTGGRTFGS